MIVASILKHELKIFLQLPENDKLISSVINTEENLAVIYKEWKRKYSPNQTPISTKIKQVKLRSRCGPRYVDLIFNKRSSTDANQMMIGDRAYPSL